MNNLLLRLPLASHQEARELQQLSQSLDATVIAQYIQSKAKPLTSSWLGRQVVLDSLSKVKLNPKQIISLWVSLAENAPSVKTTWDLWKRLSQNGVSLNEGKANLIWKYQQLPKNKSHFPRELLHRITVLARLSLETVIYYFGISPKYIFSARSLWDMQHRYESLQRLLGLLTTSLISLQQAHLWIPIVSKQVGVSLSFFPQLALTVLVAGGLFVSISLLFYGLSRLLQIAPSELWSCKNLCYGALQGQFKPLVQRDEEIKTLSSMLCAGSCAIAWIRGNAGSGKTALVKELARRLSLGKLPKALGQPQIFLINAAVFDGGGFVSATEKLEGLSNEIEGFEKQIILAIDECHLLDKALVEQLKGWRDRGLRIIFLTNSPDSLLEAKWGKETLHSLITHTQFSVIELKGASKPLVESMIEESMKSDPHTRLTDEAHQLLCDHFVDDPSAPRLLSLSLDQLLTKAHFKQQHTQELLDLDLSIESAEQTLFQSSRKSEWTQADAAAAKIQAANEARAALLGKCESEVKQLQTIRLLQGHQAWFRLQAIQLAQTSKLRSSEESLLNTLQPVLLELQKREQLAQDKLMGGYPYLLDKSHCESLLGLKKAIVS